MNTLPTIHLNPDQLSFKTLKESFVIKMNRDEVADLNIMLYICINTEAKEQELELLILEELREVLKKKLALVGFRMSIKLTRSQARTLFMWLNQFDFPHPLHNNLAGRLVDQIYKQLF